MTVFNTEAINMSVDIFVQKKATTRSTLSNTLTFSSRPLPVLVDAMIVNRQCDRDISHTDNNIHLLCYAQPIGLSVRLIVPCLTLSREWKGVGS